MSPATPHKIGKGNRQSGKEKVGEGNEKFHSKPRVFVMVITVWMGQKTEEWRRSRESSGIDGKSCNTKLCIRNIFYWLWMVIQCEMRLMYVISQLIRENILMARVRITFKVTYQGLSTTSHALTWRLQITVWFHVYLVEKNLEDDTNRWSYAHGESMGYR